MTRGTRRDVLRGIAVGSAVAGGAGSVGAASGGDEAGLRVAHASPDAPAVDVYVEGTRVIEGLAFGGVSPYLELPAGAYDVAVTAAGSPSAVVFDATLSLAAEDYTATALGELTGDDTDFTVAVFEDTNGANLAGDEARVRVVHASPDAPAVDVTVDDGAVTVFDGVDRFTSGGYAVVPATSYDVEVRPDTSGNDGPVVFETPLTLEGGSTYTVFATGYLTPGDEPADEAFDLVVSEDATAPPRGGGAGGRGRGR